MYYQRAKLLFLCEKQTCRNEKQTYDFAFSATFDKFAPVIRAKKKQLIL